MKVLVTGAEGQVARSLSEAGNARNIDVVAVGRPRLDITDPASLSRAIAELRPTVIVNAAAYTAVDDAEDHPDQAQSVNATGAKNVAEASAEADIPLIQISTDYVFDGQKQGFYNEEDPVSPLGVYGRSKLEGEREVASVQPKHIILRTAWVFSPYGRNFLKTMLRLAETRDQLNVVDDQRGSPTYAPHLADAILTIAEQVTNTQSGPPLWGTYNAAGAGEASWRDFAGEIFRVSAERGGPSAVANPIGTADYPTPAARPANSRLDCDKLDRTFLVRLPDWHQGVEDCLDALQSGVAAE